MAEPLAKLVREEILTSVDPRVTAMAQAIAARHGSASRAVLFYGSCLRETQLDGLMLDFYLIVSSYDAAYDRRWLALANRLIPPNVFAFSDGQLVAKYAVLSEADFHRLNGSETKMVSTWARFAQPSRLVWSAGPEATDAAVQAIARAAPALLAAAGRVAGEDALDWWRRAFALTYSAELRAERGGRSRSVVDSAPDRYVRFTALAVEALPAAERTSWGWRRVLGKAYAIPRLAKASLTFADGADYIAWKINRHAGTNIVLKPWQRRWPLLAALTLLPRLLRSGAIR